MFESTGWNIYSESESRQTAVASRLGNTCSVVVFLSQQRVRIARTASLSDAAVSRIMDLLGAEERHVAGIRMIITGSFVP